MDHADWCTLDGDGPDCAECSCGLASLDAFRDAVTKRGIDKADIFDKMAVDLQRVIDDYFRGSISRGDFVALVRELAE